MTAPTATPTAPTFEDVTIPQVTRTGPNPYAEKVASLKGTDKAAAFLVKGSTETGRKGNKALNTARRLLSQAGHAAGVSVRVSTEAVTEKSAGGPAVKVTFWTTDRITRTKK